MAKGIRIGRKRVARLMRRAGLAAVSRRRFVITTVKGDSRRAPDLVERNFTAEGPDRLWVADITYISTWAGFLYLAVVLDAYSRRIVGWSMATTLATQLVLDALDMAVVRRRPPLRATVAASCGPGRKNGSAWGQTEECLDTGGQYAVKSDRLIPSSHPSTKPRQVHGSEKPQFCLSF
jgi:transposase InsO family protein